MTAMPNDATPAYGTPGGKVGGRGGTTPDGLYHWGYFHPWKGATRIPLPEDATGTCALDGGRPVAVVWFEGGSIRQLCADHDPGKALVPYRPATAPSWWRYPWPYGSPPGYGARVAAWLRVFPRPRRRRLP